MRKIFTRISLLACGLAAGSLTHASPADGSDEIAAAFARMLQHTPAQHAPARLVASHRDPLLAHLVAALAQRNGPAATSPGSARRSTAPGNLPTDPLAASFQRMLGHQPGSAAVEFDSASASDPLLSHLVAALRTERPAAPYQPRP